MTDTTAASGQPLMVYVTCPDAGTAQGIATALVEARDAACVNIISGVRSLYRWQGSVEMDDEQLLLIKTRRPRLPAIQATLDRLHPEELPELVAVDINGGSDAYLRWLDAETR